MKKRTIIILPLLAFFITGCGLFKIGRRTRSSSEQTTSENQSSDKDSSSHGGGSSHSGGSSSEGGSSGNPTSSQPGTSEVRTYRVEYDQSDEYYIEGLDYSYEVGQVVSFRIHMNVDDKVVDRVLANGTELTSYMGTYSFYMPMGNVYLAISLRAASSGESFSFEQIPYELKPGVSRSELEGAPWINSNLEGMVEKIEKPSLKDDFYTSVNYEAILNGENGYLDQSGVEVNSVMNEIFDSSSGAPNSSFISRAWDLSVYGCASDIDSYFSSFDLASFMSTKDLFSNSHSLFGLSKEDGVYYITYNDGYFYGDTNFATLALAGYYDASYDIFYYLNDAFNINMSDSEFTASYEFNYYVGMTCYEAYNDYGDDWQTFNVGGSYSGINSWLNNALLDYGLTSYDTVKIAYPAVRAISTMGGYDSSVIEDSLISRLAFSYRGLTGASYYRVISSYVAATGWFRDPDLTNYGDDVVAYYATIITFDSLIQSAYLKMTASTSVKNQITGVIEDVISKYKDLAVTYEWLDNSTKNGVYRKLDNMSYLSCYSDRMRDYPLIDSNGINGMSLFELFNRYSDWLADLKAGDLYEWNPYWYVMTTYTVNAFYMPTANGFVILNGVLGGFPLDGSIEEILGSIGMVIGHEISHSIDSSGSQYDEYGRYNNWWSASSANNFNEKVNKMINFYDQINAFGSTYVDGSSCNGEATADMGGIHVCLEIAKEYDNFDYDLFFKTYTRLWLTSPYTYTGMTTRVTDVHPLNYLRVNVTLAQFEEFYQTYSIGPGDRMYIPEDERVAIW